MVVDGRKTRSVYIPAWCCDSMLQPFIDRGVEIQLYDVSYNEGRLKYDVEFGQRADILYVNNYFGYENTLPIDVIKDFKKHGAVVVYDRTHSLFREDKEYIELSDYTFASIRKWMGVFCGAYLAKKSGELVLPTLRDYPYLSEKMEAMKMKAAYMVADTTIDKQRFLNLYGSFGHHLAEDYRNYKMDEQSQKLWFYADHRAIRKWRNINANYLQICLNNVEQVKPMFTMTSNDCALFVPVLFATKQKRDEVRKQLISKAIYCPIHWPKPRIVDGSLKANDIYDRELSLLCDQRYDSEDMQHIVDSIKEII